MLIIEIYQYINTKCAQHLEHKSTGTMKGSETLNYSQQTMSIGTQILTTETLLHYISHWWLSSQIPRIA